MFDTDLPTVLLTDPGVQTAFSTAVKNLIEINTIPCDFTIHNDTGLLDASEPFLIRAGGGYDTPWTRDAAINTWTAGSLLIPRAARNTLFAVCVNDEQGKPIIQPDNQQWDRIVWAVGAWQYYLATGDQEFLSIARGIIARGLAGLHRERFCAETGLYIGGSFFNDGISGYPKDIYEPGVDHSFMGMHRKTETIMCLSTNCIYCEAWSILGKMNRLLGITDPEPEMRSRQLREAIVRTFWDPEEKKCSYILYPDGRKDPSQELSGISFGVLFGILPAESLEHLREEKFGIPSILPPFPGLFSPSRPGRHNNLIWPFLNGFYIQAAANAGLEDLAAKELMNYTRLINSADGIYEIYDPYDGSVNGGWQIGGDDLQGHLWDSCHDQTWSAASYIGAILQGVFGIQIREDGVAFTPCVPEYLKNSRISGLVIRGKRFNITVSGFGSRVRAATVNGQPCDRAWIRFEEAADVNEIVLTLYNKKECC